MEKARLSRNKVTISIVLLLLLMILGFYFGSFFKSKIIIENDVGVANDYTLHYVGVSKSYSFTLGPRKSNTIYISFDDSPKGKVKICLKENQKCKVISRICRGFGTCSNSKLVQHVMYSKMSNGPG